MTKRKNSSDSQSTRDIYTSLVSAIKAAYNLAPLSALTSFLLSTIVIAVSLSFAKSYVGCITIIVFFSSVFLYAKTANFGEATVSLAAGLFAAFTVNWGKDSFITFSVAWVVFVLLVLLWQGIRLAASSEHIYRGAALRISPKNYKQTEKDLQKISDQASTQKMGPIERANVIFLLARREVPIEAMQKALEAVDVLAITTEIEYVEIASIVVDVFKVMGSRTHLLEKYIPDKIHHTVYHNPILPIEFAKAFKYSRNLLLSKQIELDKYLAYIADALVQGVLPENIQQYIEDKLPN